MTAQLPVPVPAATATYQASNPASAWPNNLTITATTRPGTWTHQATITAHPRPPR